MSRRRWAAATAVGCLLVGLVAAVAVAAVLFVAWFALTVLTGIGSSVAAALTAVKAIGNAVFGPMAWVVPELARWLAVLGDWVGVYRP